MPITATLPGVGRLLRPALSPLAGRASALVPEAESLARTWPSWLARTLELRRRDAELAYWVEAAAGRAGLPGPLWDVFGLWQRTRLFELADRLGFAEGLTPGGPIDGPMAAWCRSQRAVEVGPGPHPALAEATWRSATAVDPLADGYRARGLTPPHADRVVWLAATGEAVPLPGARTDLVICENCLDHVESPDAVVGEMRRLLRPGGLAWVLIDMMDEADDLHPHPFNEAGARALFQRHGFGVEWAAVWSGHSHPRAHGQWRALLSAAGEAA